MHIGIVRGVLIEKVIGMGVGSKRRVRRNGYDSSDSHGFCSLKYVFHSLEVDLIEFSDEPGMNQPGAVEKDASLHSFAKPPAVPLIANISEDDLYDVRGFSEILFLAGKNQDAYFFGI